VTRLRFIQLVVGFLDDDDEASLDVRLDLQATRHSLVVIALKKASFDVRFDFHTYHYSIRMLTLNIERRRPTLGFEAEERRSPGKAGTGGRILRPVIRDVKSKKPGAALKSARFAPGIDVAAFWELGE
jgi:hypothetical protein